MSVTDDRDASISGDGKWVSNVSVNILEYRIPDGVEAIGWQAFAHCDKLTTVHIPSSVRLISAKAFIGCSSLRSVDIPEGISARLHTQVGRRGAPVARDVYR